MARLLSGNVGRPRGIEWNGRTVHTGIWKDPVRGLPKSSSGCDVTLFAYALHRRDPVFMIGEAAGTLIYLRNPYLIWRKYRPLVGADV